MGSLTKRPTIPKQPQHIVRYVPTPSASVPSTPQTGGEPSTSESVKEAKKESLLRRSRGRLGTILTGFRGLLTQTKPSTRKSLLGE